jgi:exopolysaccharide biosynthesis polyprenyl glycosylphosphotransferase
MSTSTGKQRPPPDRAPIRDASGRAPAHDHLHSWGPSFARRLAVTDAVIILWATVGVQLALVNDSDPSLGPGALSTGSMILVAGLAFAWFAALHYTGSRDYRFVGVNGTEYKNVVRATLYLFGGIAICGFVFPLDIKRAYLLVMMPAGLAMLLAGRRLWRGWLHRQRAGGRMLTRVLAVGDGRTVNELVRDLCRAPASGYVVVAACVPSGTTPESVDVPIVGGLDGVGATVRRIHADAVAVAASGAFGADAVRDLGWALGDADTELMLAPALTNIAGPRIHTQPVAGLPLIHVAPPQYHAANRLLKRVFDLAGAFVLLVVLLPVFLVTAIAITVDSPGPVFFRQQRAGLSGREFEILKFRSMVPDAESRLADLIRRADAGNEVLFKLRRDPRVTRVGRIIRRYSIDELPQLINVISGSMSLVGPRPPLMSEIQLYGPEARRRLLVKPGMTGLWQISGRSNLTWDESIGLDMYYVENGSLTTDLAILWRTAKAVLKTDGAF